MRKEIALGIKVIGIWFIISGVTGVFSLLDMRAFYLNNTGAFPFPYSHIRLFTDSLLPVLSLVGGIYLLKLKEWGRRFILAVCFLNLILVAVSFVPFSGRNVFVSLKEYTEKNYEAQKQEVLRRYKAEYLQQALQKLEQSHRVTVSSLPGILVFLLSLSILWNSWVIFYLMRGPGRPFFPGPQRGTEEEEKETAA